MFQQFIGTGANIFIAIVAVIVGFVSAIGFIDKQRQAEKEKPKK